MPSSLNGSVKPDNTHMKIPIQFDIMVTTTCNGRCKCCIQEATYKPETVDGELFLEALAWHFGRFYELGGRRVIITGGEPLLALPLVVDVLDSIAKYKNLEVKALYTNGTRLLDIEGGCTVTAILAKAGLGSLNLSVNHYDDQINTRLLGVNDKPATALICEELRKCGLPFRFNLVLQQGGIATVDDLLKYIEVASELGARDVYVREMAEYTFKQSLCASSRNTLTYSSTHKVSSSELVSELKTRPEVRFLGGKREKFRDKWEAHFVHISTGCNFSLAANVIGSEKSEGLPYLVLMPDAQLYRGWLGGEDVLEQL
jgi:molybdenum cofactor biosynthesis enzyme MoaA